MVKLQTISESYVNVSGSVYDSEYINLVQIENNRIAFDDRTIFLKDSTKEKLNSEEVVGNNEGVYILEQNNKYGLICNLPISEYDAGHVKNHELVIPDTIQGMLSNYHGYNSEAAPVMLISKEKIDFKQYIDSRAYSKKYKIGEVQVFYFESSKAGKIVNQFENVQSLYVGDGHHRLYSTSLSGFKQTVLSYIVNIDDVNILPIQRQLPHISDQLFEKSLEFITKKFDTEEIFEDNPKAIKNTIIMTRGNRKWRIHLIKLFSDGFWNNDIYRLNTQIIQQAFRSFDDKKIRFLSEASCKRAMDKSNKSVFFLVQPMKREEFIQSANDGNILPPKSTWMSPKAPSLLIMSKYQ